MNFDNLRFGAGRAGDRDELRTLATGGGNYTSDIDHPGQLHACFVRSNEAHAHIRGIDATRALALPGVRAVITGSDLEAAGIGVIPPLAIFNGRDGKPMFQAGIRWPMARCAMSVKRWRWWSRTACRWQSTVPAWWRSSSWPCQWSAT